MKKTALIHISVPEDAEDPLCLLVDALERYCGRTYPIWTAPLDDDPAFQNTDHAIVLEEEAL